MARFIKLDILTTTSDSTFYEIWLTDDDNYNYLSYYFDRTNREDGYSFQYFDNLEIQHIISQVLWRIVHDMIYPSGKGDSAIKLILKIKILYDPVPVSKSSIILIKYPLASRDVYFSKKIFTSDSHTTSYPS